jgi:hypothetical protein
MGSSLAPDTPGSSGKACLTTPAAPATSTRSSTESSWSGMRMSLWICTTTPATCSLRVQATSATSRPSLSARLIGPAPAASPRTLRR